MGISIDENAEPIQALGLSPKLGLLSPELPSPIGIRMSATSNRSPCSFCPAKSSQKLSGQYVQTDYPPQLVWLACGTRPSGSNSPRLETPNELLRIICLYSKPRTPREDICFRECLFGFRGLCRLGAE